MSETKTTRVKRSQLAGLLLRPLGHGYWGVEQTDDGFTFLGRGGRRIAFSDLAGSPKKTKALGFKAASFPLKSGSDVKLVGLKENDVAQLVTSAQSALRLYYSAIVEASEDELQALVRAVSRLDDPRRYPSACLLKPFLSRTSALLEKLPDSIPEGVLREEKERLLGKLRRFASNPTCSNRAVICLIFAVKRPRS